MLRIAYENKDGTVAVVMAAPKESLEKLMGALTYEEYRRHVYDRSVPTDAANVHELPDDWESPDRYFRGAWVTNGKNITIDMAKARIIHLNTIRAARAPLLMALDVQIAKADDVGDSKLKSEIGVKRQLLRDITDNPQINEARTPAQLKAIWPDVLSNIKK